MRIHIVQKGETLWRIAKQYGIGLDELKRLNAHLANPDYIVPGMEIILPEGGTAALKSTMTKAQQTAPMSKEMATAPKVQQTKPVEKAQPVKEAPKAKETAPIPEPVPMPMPQPAPQVELTPQFQFDFAPQMHFQQPQPLPAPVPAPQPTPQPQPIYIQVPQTQVETNVETTVEKEVEYVQIPVQPQIIYVYCQPPQPCVGHEPVYYHNPCGCQEQQFHQPHPCGCQEQQFHQPHPCGCQEQQFHQPHPCGCQEQPHFQQAAFDFQQMPQQQHDCGCGGGYPAQEMMPYGMPYFEPNYDMAPMTDVAPAMEGPYEEHHDGLPEWLLDSSEMKANMVEQDCEPEVGPQAFDEYNPYDQMADHGQVANYYQDGYNYGNSAYPYPQNPYGSYNMQQGLPQQMMQPNCQGYPYNPYLTQNKPWNY
ncbi:LysM peptidoglycan-binding domain-containing protein [Ureibacillus chungkukjangi]|uniref:Morphogenetic protein associated with SpoVID n=1 Tax=Ureibacillus chungkukjangi TaxID=1202712 RepID=A0A318U391_9BACL|nr:LysM domain-containing protein [Ureibacillus chungkukjangi]PYF08855.1 morphogenetic protein associated with SpoVID [Ureibacillus chungkukjangi]